MNYLGGRTVAFGIALIFVFVANIPAIDLETENVVDYQSAKESENIVLGLEETMVLVEETFNEKIKINNVGSNRSPSTFYDGWYHKADTYEELVHWYLMLEQNYSDYIEVFKANELYNTGTVPDQNYDLYYVRVTNESLGFHKPEVLFVGGTHGDERVGTDNLYWAVDWLMRYSQHPDYLCSQSKWLNWLLDNREIYIVICHNPYGWDNYKRSDGSFLPWSGYDLNREADHMSLYQPAFPSVNGKTMREFVNNHLIRIGIFLHDGTRAILYPWWGQHNITPPVIGVSPHTGKIYERVPADFYFYDAAGLILGDFIGDYGGDLHKNNIINSYMRWGGDSGGCISHWCYGGDTERNSAEIPYVGGGSYPGCGILGFTPEISDDKNTSEETYGNDTVKRFGAELQRQLLFFTDFVQPSVHFLSQIPETIAVGETINLEWDVSGCLVVDHTNIQWGLSPDPINDSEFVTLDNDEHYGDYYGGSRWDNAENGDISGVSYSENITLNTVGDYYFVAKAMVDQIYADVLRPDHYGNDSYLRLIKERTNDTYFEELNGTDGLEQIQGQLWWHSPIIHINVTSSHHDESLSFFNWSSSDDWRNGTSSQTYICEGTVGIGGYDDFEGYSEGLLSGDWGERISSSWWTFYNNSGDICLKYEADVDNSRSMAITDQWGNISNSTVQAKVINVGDSAVCFLQSRVAWEKNTMSTNCDFYTCRNDLRISRDRFEIAEYDDGVFNFLTYGDSGTAVNGSVYQKLMTLKNGPYTDLYAKVWSVSDIEPDWQRINTNEVTNDGAEDGCFGVFGYTDDVFFVSDFWLIGGYSNGSHITEWRNADKSVNWSEFKYIANNISYGNQNIMITVQVSNNGISVLDSLSFYANNGYNEMDISDLLSAQYIRVITDFTTTDETMTAEISFYSIDFKYKENIFNQITNLNFEWNFVSVPFNQTINKEDIIVKYDDTYYNWTQATADGIILRDIYTWLRTPQYYDFTNTLQPGYGYWMYAYYSCELWVEGIGNIDEDNYIADLASEWNIIGLPSNESLSKEDFVIRYDGTDYNWSQATADGIILRDIYTWLRTPQYYDFTNTLQPGYAYWMYAYYDCTLLRPET